MADRKRRQKTVQYELIKQPENSRLWNIDIRPTPIKDRKWNAWNVGGLWIAMSVSIASYMLASSMISSGMNWWQAVITVFIGCVVVLIPMLLISSPGVKYGIPFPVLARSSFGTDGAKLPAMLRALIACGWFGIQTTIGGNALYFVVIILLPYTKNSLYLGNFIGLNLTQFTCIMIFWFIQLIVFSFGMHAIKRLSTYAAPILIACGLALLIWAWLKVGSFDKMSAGTYLIAKTDKISFWTIFFPSLTAVVGFWSTLALNIPDFMRFVKSQKSQVIGQSLTMPITMVLYTFIGIIVTGATIVLYGKALWDPTFILNHFSNPFILLVSLFCILLATMCCNITANLVSPGNDFSSLLPKFITFRKGAYIGAVIALIIRPWNLIADPSGYIFKWLVAYSALLGSIAGIMIADYYFIRKRKMNLDDLFSENGIYSFSKGWNISAIIALILSVTPNIPGFLIYINVVNRSFFPSWVGSLYDYAWFISFGISFFVYLILMKGFNKNNIPNIGGNNVNAY